MKTEPCKNSTDFLQKIAELQQDKELPQPQEVKLFLENNQRWLNELSQNPDLGSKLQDLAERIEKIETEKVVSSFIRHIAEDMKFPDEVASRIMQMTVGDRSTVNRIAESSSLGRSETLRAKAEMINESRTGIRTVGGGNPQQATTFVTSLGQTLQYLDLTDIEVTTDNILTIANACPEVTHLVVNSSKLDDNFSEVLSKFSKLEVLDLRKCSGITKCNLQNIESLVKCHLDNSSIKELSIQSMQSLSYLSFEQCDDLQEVTVHSAPQLQELFGGTCEELKKINFLNELRKLHVINLPGCLSLDSFHASNILHVEDLCLYQAESLRSLTITDMNALKVLDIGSSAVEIIDGVETLSSLEELHIEGCKMLNKNFLSVLSGVAVFQ